MTATNAILFVIAIIGCLIGVLGYFSGHEKSTKEEVRETAEWRATMNTKLDMMLGISPRVEDLEESVQEHEVAIAKLQDSPASKELNALRGTVQKHEVDISKLKDSSIRAHERLDLVLGGRDGHKHEETH